MTTHPNRNTAPSRRWLARPLGVLGFLGASAIAATQASAAVILVRSPSPLPPPLQDGLTWQTAYEDLQVALAQAVAGDEIWVADGVYSPTSGNDRTISFVLKQGVKLRGGFTANPAVPGERSPLNGGCRLTGHIGGVGVADNSFHVVRGTSLTNATVLEGFMIDNGNANGAGNDGFGGACLLINSTPSIANCYFDANNANKGGALARLGGISASSTMIIAG